MDIPALQFLSISKNQFKNFKYMKLLSKTAYKDI